MKRVIIHWTAGGHKANSVDKKAYHLLIEGDGNVIKGDFPISANANPTPGKYAAHTLNCNTGSIGVSLCGMVGAKESPFDPGKQPINEVQFKKLAKVVAELCKEYGIPVTPQTVLTHAEVEKSLGIKQKSKWDISVLPWNGIKGAGTIGDLIRENVEREMRQKPTFEVKPYKTSDYVKPATSETKFPVWGLAIILAVVAIVFYIIQGNFP